MERLFSPCTRLRDVLESLVYFELFIRNSIEPLQELNLNVSTEELFSAERAFTYADLYDMLGNENTLAWLTPHAAVARGGTEMLYCWEQLNTSCRFRIGTDDGKEIYALARSPEHLLDICDGVLRLLAAASVVHSVILCNRNSIDDGARSSAKVSMFYHCTI
jgi:hypothetical protein